MSKSHASDGKGASSSAAGHADNESTTTFSKCMCAKPWCNSEFRKHHPLGKHSKVFPNKASMDIREKICYDLGLSVGEVDWTKANHRISVLHFKLADMDFTLNEHGRYEFSGIKNATYSTASNAEELNMPLPCASHQDVTDSIPMIKALLATQNAVALPPPASSATSTRATNRDTVQAAVEEKESYSINLRSAGSFGFQHPAPNAASILNLNSSSIDAGHRRKRKKAVEGEELAPEEVEHEEFEHPKHANVGRPQTSPRDLAGVFQTDILERIMDDIERHARNCNGQRVKKHKCFSQHGLMLSAVCHCSRGINCSDPFWKANGGKSTRWYSSGMVTLPDGNFEATINLKHALALETTTVNESGAEQFLMTLQLNPRSVDTMRILRRDVVAPLIKKAFDRLRDSQYNSLRGTGPLQAMFDVGHNSPRYAEGSVGSLCINQMLVDINTNTEPNSASRELKILHCMLDETKARGLDIESVVIDKNVANAAAIRKETRVNAADPRLQDHKIKCCLDVYHNGNLVVVNGAKAVVAMATTLEKSMKTCLRSNVPIAAFLNCYEEAAMVPFHKFFGNFEVMFADKGKISWEAANISDESMVELAASNGLQPKSLLTSDWKNVLESWNANIPASSERATTIEEVVIKPDQKSGTSRKCLLAVALSIQDKIASSVLFPDIIAAHSSTGSGSNAGSSSVSIAGTSGDISVGDLDLSTDTIDMYLSCTCDAGATTTTQQEAGSLIQKASSSAAVGADKLTIHSKSSHPDIVSYLRTNLPAVCFAGYNYCISVPEVAEEALSRAQQMSDTKESGSSSSLEPTFCPEEVVGDEVRRVSIKSKCFGGGKITAKAVRSLPEARAEECAAYIADCLQVHLDPSERAKFLQSQNLKDKRCYIHAHLWILESAEDDIAVAVSTAISLFNVRLKSYARLFKTLLRIANEVYGGFNSSFLMYFVVSGLLNNKEHNCNNHEHCGRYLSYAQCCVGVEESSADHLFTPTHAYCTDPGTIRGPRCRRWITRLYKALVISWTLSHFMEGTCWSSILYSVTTLCESFNRFMGLMVPKSLSFQPERYHLAAKAAYLIFVWRHEEKSPRRNRKLYVNKSIGGMIVHQGQAHGKYERWPAELVKEMVPDDEFTRNAADRVIRKANLKQLKREQRMDRLQALTEENELSTDLGLGTVQRKEVTTSIDGMTTNVQRRSSALWEFPPFPFQRESLLTEELKVRRRKVLIATKELGNRTKVASSSLIQEPQDAPVQQQQEVEMGADDDGNDGDDEREEDN